MSETASTAVCGDHLLVEQQGEWLTVWFNQPEKRNPLSTAMTDELLVVLHEVARDRGIRGVTLRGKGGYFCAGGDLAGFHRMFEADRDTVIAMSEQAAVLFAAIDQLPQVTIALVEGAAMAGGLGLVCCCDVALGTRGAKFGFSETQIGITPAQIARYVVAKVGPAVARRLLVTAARFDGECAAQWGLLDIMEDDVSELEAREAALRQDVLRCAPGAIAATKALLRQLPETPAAEIPRLAGENFAYAFMSAEGREGIASFIEKRRPHWYREN